MKLMIKHFHIETKWNFSLKNDFLKTLIFPDHSLIQICTFKNSFINLNKSLSKTDNMVLY